MYFATEYKYVIKAHTCGAIIRLGLILLAILFELGFGNSPVKRIALPGYHCPQNLGLLYF